MTLAFGIKIILETAASILVIWGLMNESRIAAFEHAFVKAVKLTVREKKSRQALKAAPDYDTDRIMKKTSSLSYEERERRANAAAYARRQAVKISESEASRAERYISAFEQTSRVA